MMDQAIRDFPRQFAFKPTVENAAKLKKTDKFIIAGMGGSHLAADLFKIWKPDLDITIHNDYSPVNLKKAVLKKSLIVASSYSGNTEETVDVFKWALKNKLGLAAISVGGKLRELALKNKIPYIQLPDTGIQPRSATGLSFIALAKLMGENAVLKNIAGLSVSLKPDDYEERGKILAEKLKSFVPVIYASARNFPIAQNWKIKFNETGKVPAFCNQLPELNHNEMTSFDVKDATRPLSEKFYFIFLKDGNDHPRVIKRMEIMEKLYRERGLRMETITIEGKNIFHKIFSSLILADWTAFHTARLYGVESEQVPMVEEFKEMIKQKET